MNCVKTKIGLKSPIRTQKEIRTPTLFRALPPQGSVSTSSTTWAGKTCDSAGVRTQDPLIKSQMLYQLSYRINYSNNDPCFGSTKVVRFYRMSNEMKIYFSFFLLLFSFALPAKVFAEVLPPGLTLNKADQLYDSDKYTEAIDLYSELYKEGYYSQRMLYRLSFMHEKLQNYPEAIYYLRKIGQEYGDERIEKKVRKIIRTQGGKRLFTSDGLDDYYSFFRSWGLILYILFGLSVAWLVTNYLVKWKKKHQSRAVATGISWSLFLITGTFLVYHSFFLSTRAVIVQPTSFYAQPSYAAEKYEGRLSLGETVTINGREAFWCEVSAGGQSFWVPQMVLREL